LRTDDHQLQRLRLRAAALRHPGDLEAVAAGLELLRELQLESKGPCAADGRAALGEDPASADEGDLELAGARCRERQEENLLAGLQLLRRHHAEPANARVLCAASAGLLGDRRRTDGAL